MGLCVCACLESVWEMLKSVPFGLAKCVHLDSAVLALPSSLFCGLSVTALVASPTDVGARKSLNSSHNAHFGSLAVGGWCRGPNEVSIKWRRGMASW